jgi:cytidylate kinase
MPRIIISGLTAAGKTTHGRMLAAQLSIPYFSGSGLLSQLVGMPGPWTPETDLSRGHGSHDRELDRLMIRQFTENSDGVFDAWTLPWLTSGDALKVWIESDPPSRVLKALVTELRRGKTPVASEVEKMIKDKDDFSRALFKKLYEFDLYSDHGVFDLIVDNSRYITESTIADSDRGIRAFGPVIAAEIDRCLKVS